MQIDIYSHGFVVSQLDGRTLPSVKTLLRLLGQPEFRPSGGGRYERFIARTFAGGVADRTQFTFHIGLLDRLMALLAEYSPGLVPHIVRHDAPKGTLVEFVLKDTRPPRPYQVPAIEYCVGPGSTKLVTLGPGRGKTFVLIRSLVLRGKRVAFVIKPQYIPKWIDDFEEATGLSKEEVLVVEGSKNLATLMQLGEMDQIKAKVILISNATYRNYLGTYEQLGSAYLHTAGFSVTPYDFFETIGVDTLAIDEIHQDFHFNFRLIIYSNVDAIWTLSGTFDPDDEFKKKMGWLLFPPDLRFVEDKPPPYIHAKALRYQFRKPESMKWSHRGRSEYSHTALEKCIMKNKTTLKAYLDMISTIVKSEYIHNHVHGYPMLIFAASKKMCTAIRDRLASDYPDVSVVRYNSGVDPFENLQSGGIIVSTKNSCGTAQDIKRLTHTLMTDSINDTQANLQLLKRLRQPAEGEDYTPEFLYLMCQDINQHVSYHEKKVKIFNGEVASHQLLVTDFLI